MTMFKIARITNHLGVTKVSPTAKSRIGRVIDLDASKIEVGRAGFLVCVNPGFSDSLMTSRINHVYVSDDVITVWTKNSIYWLQKEGANRHDRLQD